MNLFRLRFGIVLLGVVGLLIVGAKMTGAQDTPAGTPTLTPSSTPTLTPTLTPTVTPQGIQLVLQVSNGGDDANESSGVFEPAQDNLWIGNGGSTTDQYLALRFMNVGIPPGSIVHAAHLEVNSTDNQWIRLAYFLGAEAADNSAPFTPDDPPSRRELTEAFEYQTDAPWLANTWYPLEEIGAAVQEVIDRPGWQSGNSLSIIAKGSENGGNFGRKFLSAFEADPLLAVRLVIDVSPSAISSTLPATTPLPTPTLGPTPSPCAAITLVARLAIGDTGRVPADATGRVNVRPAPSTAYAPIGQVEKGMSFTVIGGPACADGVRWFQIRYGESNDEGWLAEGQNNIYFVEPSDG